MIQTIQNRIKIPLRLLIEGVKLKVKNRKIIKVTVERRKYFLLACLDTGDRAKYFGEVAIGINYNIKKFTCNILFSEKIGRTIYMVIAPSMPEADGKNISVIHLDVIYNMINGRKTFANSELFYYC